jgi:tetratricopeptide (TPR) repeat protein
MLHTAFDRMKQNQGGLISFNSFLSTSTSKEVSLCFAEKALTKPEKVAILFEMKIDPSISSVPFASLDKLSYFQADEKEVLFSMHTIFRIGDIKPMDNDKKTRLWHVQLTLTDADDEQLRQLTEHLRMDLSFFLVSVVGNNMDPTWRLGKLLLNMGEYDKAVIVYNMMLDKAIRDNDLELEHATHYQLAEFYMLYKNDWERARAQLKKMFSKKVFDCSDVINEAKGDLNTVFATIKNIVNNEHIEEDEFHWNMSEMLNKMVTLYFNYYERELGPLDYQLIVDRYNYIGWVRKTQGNLSEAWDYHERVLKILREHLPPTHPRLAITYTYISSLHLATNNHSNALDCLDKALAIQEKALQPHHPHLAETHFNMSIVFERMNKIDDAFEHAKKAVDIGRQVFLTPDDLQMNKYRKQFDQILLLTQSCDELIL